MANQIKAPINYPVIAGGKIVAGGSVLFGQPNVKPDEDNPSTLKAVYLDAALTQPAQNPQGLSSDGVFDQSDTGILFGSNDTVYSIVIKGANKKELSYIPEYDLSDANAAATAQDAAAAAASSEANALSFKNLTEALYTDFTNRYFGPFSSDPSVDNLGNPPNEGSIYFNTVSDVFFTWNGSAWMNYFPSNPNGLMVTATGTTTPRTLADRASDSVNIKDFGAVGDYTSDDTIAIVAALNSGASSVYAPSGVYRITNGITIPKGVSVYGDSSSIMGTFPTTQDDKRFLRPTYKDKIQGTNFIFSGEGTNTATTSRGDRFSSFTYAVKVDGDNAPQRIRNISVIMDMDVLTEAGAVTLPSTDNRSNYDVGIFLSESTKATFDNVTCFGYWPVGGIVHYGSDPDETSFINCSSSGDIGFAIIGTGSHGLSGTNTIAHQFYCNDHHSRSTVENQWGTNALYIDGDTSQINGHFFTNGRVQTAADIPIALGNAKTISFVNVLFELPDFPASIGATKSNFTGTSNTEDVYFTNCRFTDDPISGAGSTFIDDVGGNIYIVNEPTFKGISTWRQGRGVRVSAASNLDASVQFTSNYRSSADGWKILRDDTDGKLAVSYNGSNVGSFALDGRMNFKSQPLEFGYELGSTLTVVSNTITITQSYHKVSFGGAATDLSTINGGSYNGQILILATNVSADQITLKDGGGNLRLSGDFLLSNGQDRITLMYDGSNWVEISRSDNT